MASKPETKIVRKIRKVLDSHFPGFYFKSHGGPFQVAGLPDIIGVHKGRFIGIEVKQPGEEPTSLQYQILDLIRAAGGIAFWATSPEEVQITMTKEFNNGKHVKRKSRSS